jgi:hypothetical protein
MRMTTMDDDRLDDRLDDLLARAAAHRPAPPPALMDRVLADALAEQQPRMTPQPRPSPRAGFLARLSQAFGGGSVLAGVTSTLLLGLVVGYLNPATVDILTGGSAEAVELFPDSDFLTTEG